MLTCAAVKGSTVCGAALADCTLGTPHASRAVPPSRFRLKTCRRHVFHTPKPSQVRVLLNEIKKKQVPIGTCFFLAAVKGFEPLHTESESAVLPLHNTAMCNFKLQVVLYNVHKAKSSLFFACLKSFGRFFSREIPPFPKAACALSRAACRLRRRSRSREPDESAVLSEYPKPL